MKTPLTREEALELVRAHGSNVAAARAVGTTESSIRRALNRLPEGIDPVILEAAKVGGITDLTSLTHFWKVVPTEDGGRFSLFIKNPLSGEEMSLTDAVRQSIEEALADKAPVFPPRPAPKGEHLLFIDLADVHFLKLCRTSHTGYEYNREIARHRVIEGTKALLEKARVHGVGRILFGLGNDILHVDNLQNTTTNGTQQTTDVDVFQGFRDAFGALNGAIEVAAEVAPVDLFHTMSNHDRLLGWALSQKVGAWFRNHPGVTGTEYNLSDLERKYYRYGANLIGVDHGDGASEEKLYGLMVKEARAHISSCRNLYWIRHHFHHKIRKRRGVSVFLDEKDHIGMTEIGKGLPTVEGQDISVEYVRSPSAPDRWHTSLGYVNRQAVECFLFHPEDGQVARFTTWF